MSIANSSRHTYNHGQYCFASFCSNHNIKPYPLSQHTLCFFAAFLARSLSYATIRTYLAALHLKNIELGYYTDFTPMQNLHMLLRGIRRVKSTSTRPSRLPITMHIMKILKSCLLSSSIHKQDRIMLWAAFTVAFFGLLRSSEYCCETHSSFTPESTLLQSDVQISKGVAVLHIKVSKANPFRNGHDVRLAPSQSSVCTFRALCKYLKFCVCPSNPLLLLAMALI